MVINEQTQYPVPGNSHTSRHGAVELLYAEKTGDWSARDAAIRRLTWATYWVDFDGKNRYPGDDIWLTDGYGDFVYVPAGAFKMGDNFGDGEARERPVHTVELDAFYIGKI